jgi:hypothetical protein
MTTVPMMAVQMLAAALGFYCLWLWFKKARKPTLIGYHLLAGLGGTEVMVATLHMSGLAADSPIRAIGLAAAVAFGLAAFSGFLAPLVGRAAPKLANWLLALHVGSGAAGLVLGLSFATQV